MGRRRAREEKTVAGARYMLDANAFDYVLDRAIEPRAVRRLGRIYITSVQHVELLNVPDPVRRKRLLRVLSGIDPTVRPGTAEVRLDPSYRDGRSVRNGEVPHATRWLRGASRGTRWSKDAAIGEAASLEGCILVTDDKGFRARAAELGVPALSCADAFSAIETGSSAEAGASSTESVAERRRHR